MSVSRKRSNRSNGDYKLAWNRVPRVSVYVVRGMAIAPAALVRDWVFGRQFYIPFNRWVFIARREERGGHAINGANELFDSQNVSTFSDSRAYMGVVSRRCLNEAATCPFPSLSITSAIIPLVALLGMFNAAAVATAVQKHLQFTIGMSRYCC